MILAGSANVRAATWSVNTPAIPVQIQNPLAVRGASVAEGSSAMYGAKKYATGKRMSE